MAAEAKQLAYSGSTARDLPLANIFEFITSDPFQRESAYVPAAHRVAPVEESRPIFVDHKSGMYYAIHPPRVEARVFQGLPRDRHPFPPFAKPRI